MFDLIHNSQTQSYDELSLQDIAAIAPAAITPTQAYNVSSRYEYINSLDIIDSMAANGFYVTGAKQRKSRKRSQIPFAAHMLTFTKRGYFNSEAPQIVIINSHDGKQAAHAYAGCLRFICSNLMIATDGPAYRMRHVGQGMAESFADMLDATAARLPEMVQEIDAMKCATISTADRKSFQRDAVKMRWTMESERKESMGAFATLETVAALDCVRRDGDAGNSVWEVLNKAQECLIRSGQTALPIVSYSRKNPTGKMRKAKSVTAFKSSIELNGKLWARALELV